MIGFLARTAIRGATHAAVQSHRAAQAREAALRAQIAAFPFSLTPKAHDVALYTDLRNGFGHLVPGRPQLTPAMPGPAEPPNDTALWMNDLPVTVRYRVEGPQFSAASAADLAGRTAEDHARRRTNGIDPSVAIVHPEWLAVWGAEAAARARYALPFADGVGADFEELFVLVRHGAVVRVTVRYPKSAIDPVTSAVLTSALEATMSFTPNRWQNVPALWPESAFLESCVVPTLKRERHQHAAMLAPNIQITQADRAPIFAALAGALENAGAPWLALDPASWQRHKDALLAPVADPSLRQAIEQSFGEARTAHDIRGIAMLVGRALEMAPSP